MIESYRNNKELFNLQCWALTCNSFFQQTSGSGFLKSLIIPVITSLFILNDTLNCLHFRGV